MVVNCNISVSGEKARRLSCDGEQHMAMMRALPSDGQNLWQGCGLIGSLVSIPSKLRRILYSEFLVEFKVPNFETLYNFIGFLYRTFPGNFLSICSIYILLFLRPTFCAES